MAAAATATATASLSISSMAAASSSTTSISTSFHRFSHKNPLLSFDYSPIILLIQTKKPKFLQFKTPITKPLLFQSLHFFHEPTSDFKIKAEKQENDDDEYGNEEEEEENDDDDEYGNEEEEEENDDDDYDEEDDDYYDDDEEEEEEEEDESTQSPAGPSQGNRLYVGNLPYSMTSAQLFELFGEAGRVLSAEIVYDRVTDRSRGFAFVKMARVDEAQAAIRMFDGSQVGGRTVKVNFPEVPLGGEREVMGPKMRSSYWTFVDSQYKIYAGNLSWTVTSESLREAFADQPGLLGVKVIYDRDTGKARGFGFITFDSAEAAQSALDAMNERMVEGRPLRLNMASERASSVDPQVEEAKSEIQTDITANAVESSMSNV